MSVPRTINSYEILGVDPSSSLETIRTAYKEQVLKWHPDRNPRNSAVACMHFKVIQHAWEQLSNEHERAWYDSVLARGPRNPEEIAEDPSNIDLKNFFLDEVLLDMSVDPEGSFAMINSWFSSIGSAEQVSAPNFGDANSSSSRVRKFYTFWQNFSTRRRFDWSAKLNVSDGHTRRERTNIMKQNIDMVEATRREWETDVRRLCRLVRALDPRVGLQPVGGEDGDEDEGEEDAHKSSPSSKKSCRSRGMAFNCVICRKKFRCDATYQTHIRSAKHMQRARKMGKRIIAGSKATSSKEIQSKPDLVIDASEAPPPLATEQAMVIDDTNVLHAPRVATVELDLEPDQRNEEREDVHATENMEVESVASHFSEDFVLIEDVAAATEPNFAMELDMWDGTINIHNYSDDDVEIIDFGLAVEDQYHGDSGRATTSATGDEIADAASAPPDLDLDMLLAQQLATGMLDATGDTDAVNLSATMMDTSNMDYLLALQLEQQDLMARQTLVPNPSLEHASVIDSDENDYDSELDTLVDAINAKMISLDDPNVNVKDLEKRLAKAIAKADRNAPQSNGGKKKRKKRRKKRKEGDKNNSGDDDQTVDSFLESFRKPREQPKTKKEMRGDKKRRRRAKVKTDPNAMPRCGVCHRAFASKVKLSRHLQANPEHVQK